MSLPQVALLIETSNAYARGLLRGIRNYVLQHGPWSIYLGEQRRGERVPAWLERWRGDGIIARVETAPIARALASMAVPLIDVSAARHLSGVPFVETDDHAIALVAAEHLRDRGFDHWAFCGDARFRWSLNRQEAFARIAASWGLPCSIFPGLRSRGGVPQWQQQRRELGRWLTSLPKPVGVLAAYDISGRQVLDACRELEIAVPDDVAVVGVDNDELLCDFAAPSLTSVEPAAVQTGYEAARLLHLLMRGEAVPPAVLVPPLGIVTRGSTDVLAISDPDVKSAVRFIREHALQDIHVEDVMRQAVVSRRILENRFKKLLGRTPHEEIERVRINFVKELLRNTELSLQQIAARCGYKHVEYMCVAFKRATTLSPGRYRSQFT